MARLRKGEAFAKLATESSLDPSKKDGGNVGWVLPAQILPALSNVLVSLLVRDDVKQAKTADSYISKGAWVSHLVLVETVSVLDAAYQRSPAQLAAALELLLSHESLVLQDADVVLAALTHFKAKPALGFSDCMVLEIARKAGHTPLGSFDKSLAKVSGVHKL